MLFRDILLVAASQGGGVAAAPAAAWPSLIGAEMMVNGDCSSSTGWNLPAGSAIAGGKMTLTAFGDNIYNDGILGPALIAGATYRCVFTTDTVAAGSIQWFLGNTQGTARSTVGTFSQDIVSDDTEGGLAVTTATMQLDNFSVKSVGLNGVEADWTFTNGAGWSADGKVVFDGTPGQTAALTGSAATAFDAAVTTNTACTVTFSGADWNSGTVQISLRGGAFVDMVLTDSGDFVKTITSGTLSGYEVKSTAGAEVRQGRVQIALA